MDGSVTEAKDRQLTYKSAGVDTEAGAALVSRIKGAAKATARPEMLGSLGGFAAMAELPSGYRNPVLVTGTDGVGTKLKLAFEHDQHDTVGQDLVAMCVNDLLVTGALPGASYSTPFPIPNNPLLAGQGVILAGLGDHHDLLGPGPVVPHGERGHAALADALDRGRRRPSGATVIRH